MVVPFLAGKCQHVSHLILAFVVFCFVFVVFCFVIIFSNTLHTLSKCALNASNFYHFLQVFDHPTPSTAVPSQMDGAPSQMPSQMPGEFTAKVLSKRLRDVAAALRCAPPQVPTVYTHRIHHTTPRNTTQHHATPRNTTQHHATPRTTITTIQIGAYLINPTTQPLPPFSPLNPLLLPLPTPTPTTPRNLKRRQVAARTRARARAIPLPAVTRETRTRGRAR